MKIEEEYRKIKALPITKKVELLKQKKYRKMLLHRKGNIPLKLYLIEKNLYINELINAKEEKIQLELVKKGFFHEQFKDSQYEKVRVQLALLGKHLQQYKNDTNWRVRGVTAKRGIYSKKYLHNKSLQKVLIWYYLKENYKNNFNLCEKCKKCGGLFHKNEWYISNSNYNFWFNIKNCPYKMEHEVLSNGFTNINHNELLNKAIQYCDDYEKN